LHYLPGRASLFVNFDEFVEIPQLLLVSGDDPMTAKIISIETKRCCDCGKTIPKKSEQFMVNDKQVACSNCWAIRAQELVQRVQIHLKT